MKKKIFTAALALMVTLVPTGAFAAELGTSSAQGDVVIMSTYGPVSFSCTNYVYVNGGSAFKASSTTLTVDISNLKGTVTATLEDTDGNAVASKVFSSNGAYSFTVTKGSFYAVKLSGNTSGQVSVVY